MAGKRWMPFYSDGSLWPLSLGQPQQEVLRIAGVFPDASLLDAYRQAYPQVAVVVSPELPSQEDAFAQALVCLLYTSTAPCWVVDFACKINSLQIRATSG